MKPETLRTLIIARTLFDQLGYLTSGEDKYMASAALVISQDALELVIVGALLELGFPGGSRTLPLLAFNTGVELGQLSIVAVVIALSVATRARVSERGILATRRVISTGIGVFGGALTLDRVVGIFAAG